MISGKQALQYWLKNADSLPNLAKKYFSLTGMDTIQVDPNDFSSNGSVHIYDLTDNSLTTSFTVGVLPNNVYFNN